jgi:serine phosphatase RsbU (regulator of sigma subunit)
MSYGQGDGLVLFTDGVTDAGPSSDQFFDLAGMLWVPSADAAAFFDN